MHLTELYPLVRTSHIGLVLLSGALFAARGIGVQLQARWSMAPAVRTLSYAIDTALLGAALFCAPTLNAADVKNYQVTGPVLEVTPTSITVQKGNDKWEIARDKDTKVTGDLKVGAKVTIYYKMVAQEVETKEGKAKEGKAKK